MAKNQRGWLRKKKYANGMTWLFCFQVTRPSDGKRVENCKPVGLVAAFPGEKAAWVEVGKLGLRNIWTTRLAGTDVQGNCRTLATP